MYVQLNIGRNIGDTPMSDGAWKNFQNIMRTSLVSLAVGPRPIPTEDWGVIYDQTEVHLGMGSMDGIVEESAHISLVITEDVQPWEINLFKDYLVKVGNIFGQDSIGFIVGSELV